MAAITPTQQVPRIGSYAPADVLRFFWEQNRTMTVLFFASFVAMTGAFIGMAIDPRMVLEQSTWAKTAKFSISFMFYAPTMIWMFSYMERPRIKGFILHSTAAILLFELALLVLQGGRGERMHFNFTTSFNGALYSTMATTILIFYIISILGGAFLIMTKLSDRTYAWALRTGMILMLVGFGLGYLMTAPTPEQMAVLEAGGSPAFIGAHTVGAPDGSAGIPFFGWSVNYGDLRIAHFIGIHGAQFMLLVGWLVMSVAARFGWTERTRLSLVGGAFLSYGGLVALVT
ncbi:MAG: hypothetical protein AAGK74_16215, partial [Chloroflexota bacterium]